MHEDGMYYNTERGDPGLQEYLLRDYNVGVDKKCSSQMAIRKLYFFAKRGPFKSS